MCFLLGRYLHISGNVVPLHRFSKEGVNAHPMAKAKTRRGARVVEEARLESVYTPKGYHEFESRSLRKKRKPLNLWFKGFLFGLVMRMVGFKACHTFFKLGILVILNE